MKLLYIHNGDFSSQGANKVQVINMCEGFNKIKIETSILGFGVNETKVRKIHALPKDIALIMLKPSENYYSRTLRLFNKFKNISKQYDNVMTRDLLLSFLVKKMFKNKKVIYELHDYDKGIIWNILFRKAFKIIDKLIVISEGLKEDIVKDGFDAKKIIVLHDGVDINKFDINISQAKAKNLLKLPLNKKIALYAGLFDDWKGYKLLLESSNINKNNKLVFTLFGGKKEEIEELRIKYPKAIIREFIDYNKLAVALKAADLLIIPNSAKYKISAKYTSPLKLFAYMASKRFILASNLPSIKEIVSEKEALFFEPDNPADMLKKINQGLKEKKVSETRVRRAFSKSNDYSWEIRAKKIMNIFEK